MRQAVYSRIDYAQPGFTPVFSESLDVFTAPQPKYFIDRLQNYNRNPDLVVWHLGWERQPPGFGYTNRLERIFYLHFILSGTGSFNGVRLSAGEGFMSWPNTAHTMIADDKDPWEYLWIGFTGSAAIRHLERCGFSSERLTFRFQRADHLTSCFQEMLYTLHPDVHLDLYLESCLLTIFAGLASCNLPAPTAAGSGYVMRAATYLRRHYTENVSICALAEALHINRQYLYRLFQNELGVTPHDYLTMLRLDRAKALLRDTDESIEAIAAQVGYNAYSPFATRFRARCGFTPTQYRKQSRSAQAGKNPP